MAGVGHANLLLQALQLGNGHVPGPCLKQLKTQEAQDDLWWQCNGRLTTLGSTLRDGDQQIWRSVHGRRLCPQTASLRSDWPVQQCQQLAWPLNQSLPHASPGQLYVTWTAAADTQLAAGTMARGSYTPIFLLQSGRGNAGECCQPPRLGEALALLPGGAAPLPPPQRGSNAACLQPCPGYLERQLGGCCRGIAPGTALQLPAAACRPWTTAARRPARRRSMWTPWG